MSLTTYHAKHFAYDRTRRSVGGIDRLSMALFDASVDLNPHQIEAAPFALVATWTVALIEAHRAFGQDQNLEKANAVFLGLIDRGTKGGSVRLKGTAYR